MLKIGLVGVGGISGAHIPAWNAMEDTTLTAICDIRPERMEPYPEPHHYTSIDEMLEKEELDILDICLPTYLHVPTAVKAMKKGIHVLSEKPISLKEEDIELAYSTAKENNVCFMIAQVLRFWPEYELIKELYDSGKYGKLLSGYMGRLGSYPAWSWRNTRQSRNLHETQTRFLFIPRWDLVMWSLHMAILLSLKKWRKRFITLDESEIAAQPP